MNASSEKFVILTGSMRSGTSLLGYLLQRTPDGQRAYPELAFENDESQWVADLFSSMAQAGAGFGDPYEWLDLSRARNALAAFLDCPEADCESVLRTQLRAEILKFAPAGPAPIMIGLKRTSMNNELAIVEELFPGTRVIFMVRNPLAVVASHCRRLQVDPTSGNGLLIIAYILSNLAMIERIRSARKFHLVVRYEDLVEKPADTIESARNFLELCAGNYLPVDFSDEMIPSNSSFNATLGAGFEYGKGIRSRQPTEGASLSEVVTAFVAWLCRPVFLAFGYEGHLEKSLPLKDFRTFFCP
jgi:hypothetical protein